MCLGFYSTIRELAHELDEEEEHERQILAQEQLERKQNQLDFLIMFPVLQSK